MHNLIASPPDRFAPNWQAALSASARSHATFIAVALIGFFLFFTEANFRTVAPDGGGGLDLQTLARLLLCGCCGLYGLAYLPLTQRYLLAPPGLWLALLGGWMVAIIPFAFNPVYSAASVMATCCVFLFAPAALLHANRTAILSASAIGVLAYVVGSWFVYYCVPSLGRDPYEASAMGGEMRLGGLNQPNGTGRQAALLVVLLVCLIYSGALRWRYGIWPLAFALFTIDQTGSRTSLLTAALVIAIATWRRVGARGKAAIAAVGGLGLCVFLAGIGAGVIAIDAEETLSAASRDGDPSEVTSLAGRTDLWWFAIKKIGEKPLTGYGHACSRGIICADHFWPTFHAHNLFLDVMMGSGVPGGLLLAAAALSLAWFAWRRPNLPPDLLVTAAVVVGLADLSMFHPIPNGYTLMFAMAVFWRAVPASPLPSLDERCEEGRLEPNLSPRGFAAGADSQPQHPACASIPTSKEQPLCQ